METTPVSLRSVLAARKAVEEHTDPHTQIRIDRLRRAMAARKYEVESGSVAEELLEESLADRLR